MRLRHRIEVLEGRIPHRLSPAAQRLKDESLRRIQEMSEAELEDFVRSGPEPAEGLVDLGEDELWELAAQGLPGGREGTFTEPAEGGMETQVSPLASPATRHTPRVLGRGRR